MAVAKQIFFCEKMHSKSHFGMTIVIFRSISYHFQILSSSNTRLYCTCTVAGRLYVDHMSLLSFPRIVASEASCVRRWGQIRFHMQSACFWLSCIHWLWQPRPLGCSRNPNPALVFLSFWISHVGSALYESCEAPLPSLELPDSFLRCTPAKASKTNPRLFSTKPLPSNWMSKSTTASFYFLSASTACPSHLDAVHDQYALCMHWTHTRLLVFDRKFVTLLFGCAGAD